MGYTYSLWHGVQEHKTFTKRIFAGVMALLFAGSIAAAMSASASTHAPSTNDENRTNGWAYVEVESADGVATLTFNNPRDFLLF